VELKKRNFRIGRGWKYNKLTFIIPAVDEAISEIRNIAESGKEIMFLFGETDNTCREVVCVERKRYTIASIKMRRESFYTKANDIKNSITYEEFKKYTLENSSFKKLDDGTIVAIYDPRYPYLKICMTLEVCKSDLNNKKDIEIFTKILAEINAPINMQLKE